MLNFLLCVYTSSLASVYQPDVGTGGRTDELTYDQPNGRKNERMNNLGLRVWLADVSVELNGMTQMVAKRTSLAIY